MFSIKTMLHSATSCPTSVLQQTGRSQRKSCKRVCQASSTWRERFQQQPAIQRPKCQATEPEAAIHNSPEEGEVGNSYTKKETGVNPGGPSVKQHCCPNCSKSFSRVSNLYRHEQTIHGQTMLGQERGSYQSIRLKKKLTAEVELSPCKKDQGKGAEFTSENLAMSDEEPDESAMTDLTGAYEQTFEQDVEELQSKQNVKRVYEMKGAVETLLAALEQNESREHKIAKQQAQQFPKTLEQMHGGSRQDSLTSVTDVELSDNEIILLDVLNSAELTEPTQEVTNGKV